MKNFVFFTVANRSQEDSFRQVEEKNQIYDLFDLEKLDPNHYFQSQEEITVSDIERALRNSQVPIEVFHFSGHSDSDRLILLEEEDQANIVDLLGAQNDLKLVFLNGASSSLVVESLLDAGVPAVINVPVQVTDNDAMSFAQNFYNSLVNEHTLEEAFKMASAFYIDKTGKQVGGIYRHCDHTGAPNERPPLGLYIRKDQERVLRWKIPRQDESPLILKEPDPKYQANELVRHTRINFPVECNLGDVVKLSIQLTIAEPIESRVQEEIAIEVTDGEEVIELIAVITAENFDVENRSKVFVMPIEKDSEVAEFTCKPVEAGQQVVEIEIYREATRISYHLVYTNVVADGE